MIWTSTTFGCHIKDDPYHSEILSVLASDGGDYTKANLLYGVCENTSLITTYNEKVVLPTSEFKAHTSLLILGLCFLIEVSTLYIDIGTYKKLVTSLDSEIPYIVWVRQLANFEYQLRVPVSPDTFFLCFPEGSKPSIQKLFSSLRAPSNAISFQSPPNQCNKISVKRKQKL